MGGGFVWAMPPPALSGHLPPPQRAAAGGAQRWLHATPA